MNELSQFAQQIQNLNKILGVGVGKKYLDSYPTLPNNEEAFNTLLYTADWSELFLDSKKKSEKIMTRIYQKACQNVDATISENPLRKYSFMELLHASGLNIQDTLQMNRSFFWIVHFLGCFHKAAYKKVYKKEWDSSLYNLNRQFRKYDYRIWSAHKTS